MIFFFYFISKMVTKVKKEIIVSVLVILTGIAIAVLPSYVTVTGQVTVNDACGSGRVNATEACDDGEGSPIPCPTDCNDSNQCTSEQLLNGGTCQANCQYANVQQGTPCDDNLFCTVSDACDGTGGCTQFSPRECVDQNACTTDSCSEQGDTCVFDPITTCTSSDGCCPQGCNNNNDNNCQVTCGNSAVESGEQCDDGNTISGDGCSSTCVTEFCGDGTTNNVNEQCDDGNQDNTDACVNCQNAVCGDTFIRTGFEQCDDGNLANNDGCNSQCQNEFCGDEILQTGIGEVCELPSTFNNPFCPQTTNDCVGAKTVVRDAFGDCNAGCGCTADAFGQPACVPSSCGATCDEDIDCPSGQACDLNSCGCVFVCGNGVLDPGEACDTAISSGPGSCPTTCDDQNDCTTDSVIGSGCQATCSNTPVQDQSPCPGGFCQSGTCIVTPPTSVPG